MKALRNYLDKVKPNFEKGGKYEKWLPIFESFETFLYVLGDVTPKKGAHVRDAIDLKRTMSIVVIALIPALLFGIWNTGYQYHMSIGQEATLVANFLYGLWQVLPIIIVSYAAGLGVEFLFVFLKGHEIEEGFLVSGMLIPLIVPVDVPLWMVAVSTAMAVLIGKEAFGGTGMNIVNPALFARAILFFAYPKQMSGDKVWVSQVGGAEGLVDGYSGATALGQLAASTDGTAVVSGTGAPLSTFDFLMGWVPGSVGETSVIAILIGAAILLYTGIGSWKIMFSGLVGGAVMGLIMNAFGSDTNQLINVNWYDHLLLGGFAFGLVFMATDPVTASQTETGKWIYGFLVGFIAILIRSLNPAYPEGVMLAILLMNVFAPLIDHYIVQSNIKRRLKRLKA